MPDCGKGNQARSALARRTRFSTPLTARPGESLSPTAALHTSPTDNSEDLAKEHLGEAPLHTLPPNLLTPISPTDNPRDRRLQSERFRMNGPGFLDVPLVPEQYRLHNPGFLDDPRVQEQHAQLPAANHPPPPTVKRASRQKTVIQSLGQGSTWPRAATNT